MIFVVYSIYTLLFASSIKHAFGWLPVCLKRKNQRIPLTFGHFVGCWEGWNVRRWKRFWNPNIHGQRRRGGVEHMITQKIRDLELQFLRLYHLSWMLECFFASPLQAVYV